MTMRASGLLLSLATFCVLSAVFLVAEWTTRNSHASDCAQLRMNANKIEASLHYLEPCMRRAQHEGAQWLVPNGPGADDFAQGVALAHDAGTLRIAVVGESSGELLGQDLADWARARSCSGYEVLNCATSGSALEHAERRFDEVMEYQPDAVIFVFGHNLAFEFETRKWLLEAQWLRSRSCLLTLPDLHPEATPGHEVDPSSRLAELERFLRRAAARAREKHVALVPTTMASNLWIPPAGDSSDESQPLYLESIYLDATGDPDSAIARLRELAKTRRGAAPRYHLGERLALLGQTDAARPELESARDEDSFRLRAPSSVNDRIRQVASDEKLVLRDTERAIAAAAPAHLAGWESFRDNVHATPAVIDREVVALVGSIRGALGRPAIDSCDPTTFHNAQKFSLAEVLRGVLQLATMGGGGNVAGPWFRGLTFATTAWLRVQPDATRGEIDAFLDGPELQRASSEARARMIEAIAEGYRIAGQPDQALAFNLRARREPVADPWVQAGLLQLRQRRVSDARDAFEHALAIDPARADARFFLDRLRTNPPSAPAPQPETKDLR